MWWNDRQKVRLTLDDLENKTVSFRCTVCGAAVPASFNPADTIDNYPLGTVFKMKEGLHKCLENPE